MVDPERRIFTEIGFWQPDANSEDGNRDVVAASSQRDINRVQSIYLSSERLERYNVTVRR